MPDANTGVTPEGQTGVTPTGQQQNPPAPAPAAAAQQTGQFNPDDEKTYSKEHVKRIHDENAARRRENERLETENTRLKDIETKFQEGETKKLADKEEWKTLYEGEQKARRDAEADLKKQVKASQRLFILSEAKRLATAAGIIDANDVETIDLSSMRIADDGAIPGLGEKIAEHKTAKPHWYKQEAQPNGQQRAATGVPAAGQQQNTTEDYRNLDTTTPEGRAKMNQAWSTIKL